MRVKELIEELEKCDPYALIQAQFYYNDDTIYSMIATNVKISDSKEPTINFLREVT